MKRFALNASVACTLLAASATAARAQQMSDQLAAQQMRPPNGPAGQIVGRSNPALSYFGGQTVVRPAPQSRAANVPRPSRPSQISPTPKPFANVRSGPTISPYLLLDNRESATGVPLYYSLVKPQLDQIQYNQRMQAEYGRMQEQLRSAAPNQGKTQGPVGSVPTTGHGTRFMDLGGYYSILRR